MNYPGQLSLAIPP